VPQPNRALRTPAGNGSDFGGARGETQSPSAQLGTPGDGTAAETSESSSAVEHATAPSHASGRPSPAPPIAEAPRSGDDAGRPLPRGTSPGRAGAGAVIRRTPGVATPGSLGGATPLDSTGPPGAAGGGRQAVGLPGERPLRSPASVEAYRAARSRAEAAVAQERIPARYRAYLRNYFAAIRPGDRD
jgi:hypothetical protein